MFTVDDLTAADQIPKIYTYYDFSMSSDAIDQLEGEITDADLAIKTLDGLASADPSMAVVAEIENTVNSQRFPLQESELDDTRGDAAEPEVSEAVSADSTKPV